MNELKALRDRAVAAARERVAGALRDGVRSARATVVWAWAHRPSPARAIAGGFAAAIALVSAWGIVAQARLPARLPTALDWAAARALLDRDGRPGDAVAVSPAWAERAREVLPSSVPVLAQRRYAGEDLVGVRRVWVLSLPDAPRFGWEVELDLLERAARSETPLRLGSFELTRYDVAFPTLPLAFLPDRMVRAAVSLGDVRCLHVSETRFVCGGGAAEVERTVRDVAGVPRPCINASAPAALAAPLAVEFPAGRIGRTLHGHLGPAGARPGSGPVRISVLLEGEEVGSAEVPLAGWVPFRIDMTRAAGTVKPLALVLTSPAPVSVCLDAVVLP